MKNSDAKAIQKNPTKSANEKCVYALAAAMLVIALSACSSADTTQQTKTSDDLIEVHLEREREQSTARSTQAQAKMAMFDAMAVEQISVTGSRVYEPFEATYAPSTNNENYANVAENKVFSVVRDPVSTFSIDVDTGSYSNVRRMLNQGILPPSDAIRIEEFVNYFDYNYPQPTEATEPFSVNTQMSISPWDPQRHLLRIALQGKHAMQESNKPKPKNLVFLLDVSGSMNQPNKLPLLKQAMLMLTRQLTAKDTVSIVVYAGSSGVVLPPTSGDQKSIIEQALNGLTAGGGTNGEQGIELAYSLAEQGMIEEGINRVLLATDGDFNLGTVDHDALMALIARKKEKGIALTTLGFGEGNYNDHLMEQLADQGNGNYAYIDSLNEARKVLVHDLNSTMHSIAQDVKVQVEFNPDVVIEYRLIGYDNRRLAAEDFNNDKVDAGEIGAGHRVTAFYELTLVGSQNTFNDPLRYEHKASLNKVEESDEVGLVKLRYKINQDDPSKLISKVISAKGVQTFDQQEADFQFASAVISFAQILKQSEFSGNMSLQQALDIAQASKGLDPFGYRSEFISLLRLTMALQPELSKLTDAGRLAIQDELATVKAQMLDTYLTTQKRILIESYSQ